MESVFAEARKPIKKLFKEEIGMDKNYISIFSGKFDMYRVVNSSSFQGVLNFAYLEHMLRPTTFQQELEEVFPTFPHRIKKILNTCLAIPDSNCYLELTNLATEEYMLRVEEAPSIVKYYTLQNSEVFYEQLVPAADRSLPICHILGLSNKHVVLYTPTMTFIDGFDPHTGEGLYKEIPNLLLKKARASIFASSKRKAVKKLLMIKTKEFHDLSPANSQRSSCHGGMSRGLAVFSPIDFIKSGDPPDVSFGSIKHDPNSDIEDVSRELPQFKKRRYSDSNRRCCSDGCSLF